MTEDKNIEMTQDKKEFAIKSTPTAAQPGVDYDEAVTQNDLYEQLKPTESMLTEMQVDQQVKDLNQEKESSEDSDEARPTSERDLSSSKTKDLCNQMNQWMD